MDDHSGRQCVAAVIAFSCTVSHDGVTKAGHAKIMKQLNLGWITRHRDDRLPLHFIDTPANRPGGGYGVRARTSKWNKEKVRSQKGITSVPVANVFTGELAESVLSKAKITATQHRARLVTRGTPTHRLTNWQRKEIASVSMAERKQEAKRAKKDYVALARSPQYKAKRRRKVA